MIKIYSYYKYTFNEIAAIGFSKNVIGDKIFFLQN